MPALPRIRSLLLVLPLSWALLACSDSGVGRKCANPTDAGVTGTQVSSPALECPSRICLLEQSQNGTDTPHTTCTDNCNSDSDCAHATVNTDPTQASTSGLCNDTFVCAVAVVSGPFCCKKMCVCRTDLVPGVNQDPVDGGAMLPSSCTPGMSMCKNVQQ